MCAHKRHDVCECMGGILTEPWGGGSGNVWVAYKQNLGEGEAGMPRLLVACPYINLNLLSKSTKKSTFGVEPFSFRTRSRFPISAANWTKGNQLCEGFPQSAATQALSFSFKYEHKLKSYV